MNGSHHYPFNYKIYREIIMTNNNPYHVDIVYNQLVKKILENGTKRNTRSSPVISDFGNFIEFDLRNGLPLITNKKKWLC